MAAQSAGVTAPASLLDRIDEDQQAIERQMRAMTLGDGSTLRVLDVGSGDPVLLLPMVTQLNFVYARQIDDLRRDHRVVLYEPRLSTSRRVGIADRAAEALALIRRLGLRRVDIVVWGDTGSAAYLLARDHPDVCRSLVFVGLADRYSFPQPYQLLLRLLRNLPLEYVVTPRVFASIMGRFVGGTQVKPEWFVQRAETVPSLTRLFKQSILPNLVEHRPAPNEVDAPCLLICGDEDHVVTVPQARRMAELLPNARPPVIVPGGEHFVSYVAGDLVNRTIRAFYASLG